jgi:hypothetical protein
VAFRTDVRPIAFGSKAVERFRRFGLAAKQLATITNTTYVTSATVCELLQPLAAQNPGVPITLVLHLPKLSIVRQPNISGLMKYNSCGYFNLWF